MNKKTHTLFDICPDCGEALHACTCEGRYATPEEREKAKRKAFVEALYQKYYGKRRRSDG